MEEPEPAREPATRRGRLTVWSVRLREALLGWHTGTFVALAALLGSAAGLVSVAFWNAIAALSAAGSFYLVRPLDRLFSLGPSWLSWAFVLPALGGLAVGVLSRRVFRTPERLGVAAVMLDARQSWGRIPGRYVPATFINSTLTIGTGGSAGREAPVVAMGGALGALLARRLGAPPLQRRLLVGCGVAAAIAAAFNAPLAGVFFALEVVLGDWRTGTLAPVMVASVAGTVLARAAEGAADASHFQVPAYELAVWWESFLYAGLGAVAGAAGQPFVRGIAYAERRFASLPAVWSPALGGLAVGVLGLWLPQVLGNGYPHIIAALAGDFPLRLLVLLALAKVVATALTLGSGGWGGDFAPTLFVGAMVGGAYGSLVHLVLPGVVAGPGAYAMVGMGALLAAVIRCPVTAIMLLFELTSSYQVILPGMVAVAAATFVASRFGRHGLYHQRLHELGGPAFEMEAERPFSGLVVRDVMHPSFETFSAEAGFRELRERVSVSTQLVFPVLEADGRLLGALRLADLRPFLAESEELLPIVAADIAVDVPQVTPEMPLEEAAELLAGSDWDEVPVVVPSTGLSCGLISRHDILRAALRN